MSMNVLFAFAGGFTVANLYYSHPILNILADEFEVKYEQVAQIPTVMRKCGSTNRLTFSLMILSKWQRLDMLRVYCSCVH